MKIIITIGIIRVKYLSIFIKIEKKDEEVDESDFWASFIEKNSLFDIMELFVMIRNHLMKITFTKKVVE
ncbi:hypothetical protein VQL36_13175 [Chengkuizengella sp. SCS-71B]|uniref:hypothetical protein n=1 Tax=Chengkuizengella sp. SCS-71B TaxID=3115290 RepID=UPI0032C20E1F